MRCAGRCQTTRNISHRTTTNRADRRTKLRQTFCRAEALLRLWWQAELLPQNYPSLFTHFTNRLQSRMCNCGPWASSFSPGYAQRDRTIRRQSLRSSRKSCRGGEFHRTDLVRFRAGKLIEFEKGKTTIVVSSLDKLAAVIDTLIAAVKAGELDGQLEAASKGVGPRKQKKAA